MDIRSNEPYWLIKNAFKKSYPSLEQSISTDILIIGGGITGALIAFKLTQEGKDVVLVDRRDVCNGSTAASTAMLQYEIDVPLHKLIEQRGEEIAVSSYKNCEAAIYGLKNIVDETGSNCRFEFKNSVYFTSHRKDVKMLENEFNARERAGFSVKWLEKNTLKDLGVNGRAAIQSASGAVIDPYKFSCDVLKFCTQNGAIIFDRTEIKKTKQKRGKMLAVTSENLKFNHPALVVFRKIGKAKQRLV